MLHLEDRARTGSSPCRLPPALQLPLPPAASTPPAACRQHSSSPRRRPPPPPAGAQPDASAAPPGGRPAAARGPRLPSASLCLGRLGVHCRPRVPPSPPSALAGLSQTPRREAGRLPSPSPAFSIGMPPAHAAPGTPLPAAQRITCQAGIASGAFTGQPRSASRVKPLSHRTHRVRGPLFRAARGS